MDRGAAGRVGNRRQSGRQTSLAITLAAIASLAGSATLLAGLAVPAYSSRPGAAYTLYLDFGGFTFTGNWGNTGRAPGTTAPYDLDGNVASFNSSELASIKESWSRIAEKYVALNVNVTTVDPAVTANQASTDSARQNYYDLTTRTMHTVIGGNGSWSGGGGGVSYVGVAQNGVPLAGYHTNWVFAGQAPSNLTFIGEAVAHENGHALGLGHQADYNGSTLVNEYSSNGTITNGNYAGDGSFAPTMGVTYYVQRGLWRIGTASNGATQNDYATLGNNSGLTLVDDGVGHSIAAATRLPLAGTAVDSSAARGYIAPTTLSNPSAIGASNYTKDFYHFFAAGGNATLVLVAGANTINSALADPGATFDGTLKIYNNFGVLVGTATRSANTLSNTFAVNNLPAGNYYAEIASIGGYNSTYDASTYFTSGSYFLRGTNLYTRFNLNGVSLVGANLTAQNLVSAGLSSANLTNANLTSATLASATLTNANFTGAIIANTNFTGVIGFTSAQLASTASYVAREVRAVNFSSLNLTGWNLSSLNLTSSILTGANLTGTNLTASDLRSVTGFAPTASTVSRNAILPNGVIGGLNLLSGESLVVHDHAISLVVASSWTMAGDSRLELRLADLNWTSTINTAIQPTLGGTLAVSLEAALDPVTLAGASFDLFNWPSSGLTADGAFASLSLAALPSGYRWLTTNLYTTGVISVVAQLGDFNKDGYVDAADYTLWADSFGQSGALLAADANFDGIVDAADYTLWADHFGEGTPSSLGGASVPESTLAAALLPALLLTGRRARR